MNKPSISVIIPPIYTVDSLNSIINSISAQTYRSYEVLVVSNNVKEYEDLQITINSPDSLIRIFEANDRDSSIFQAFNNTSGEFISILDCSDQLQQDKFELLVDLFNKNPTIGGILNPAIYVNADRKYDSIRMPGPFIDAADPSKPVFFLFSDGIFRKEWFIKFFSDDSLREIESISYLALSFYTFISTYGCQIIEADRIINFRSPKKNNISRQGSTAEETTNYIKSIFHNSACALSSAKLDEESIARIYLNLSILALDQHQTVLGQKLFRDSIRLDRSILDLGARAYLMRLLKYAIEERFEIDEFMRSLVEQLPLEFAWITEYLNESIGRGYFYKAVYNVIFGRIDDFYQNADKAKRYGANFQELDFIEIVKILEKYEFAFGRDDLQTVKMRLRYLRHVLSFQDYCRLVGMWLIKRSFRCYHAQEFSAVPTTVIQAVLVYPACLLDRGVLSIFGKSLFNVMRRLTLST